MLKIDPDFTPLKLCTRAFTKGFFYSEHVHGFRLFKTVWQVRAAKFTTKLSVILKRASFHKASSILTIKRNVVLAWEVIIMFERVEEHWILLSFPEE